MDLLYASYVRDELEKHRNKGPCGPVVCQLREG